MAGKWEPNAVLVPKQWVLDLLDGQITNETFATHIITLYGADRPSDTVIHPAGRIDLTTTEPAPTPQPDDTVVQTILTIVTSRFPGTSVPSRERITELYELAGCNMSVIDDVFSIVEHMKKTRPVTSPAGLALSMLRNNGIDAVVADAAGKRKQREKNPVSFVEDVLKEAESKIPTLPARTGANAAKVAQMKSGLAAMKGASG